MALIAILLSSQGNVGSLVSTWSSTPAIQSPILKWQKGGCYSSWCETGWYSSPAVADLEGDGVVQVIGASYSTVILDGRNGNLIKRVDPPVAGARVWPGVVVADVNADGQLEIVTAHGSGYVRLLDRTGNVLWTRQPAGNELRGLSVYDLDSDGRLEIVVTGALSSQTNTWVFEPDGALRNGWPQLSNASGYAAGVYNANAAIGDLNGDDKGELVVPSDVHYICAYDRDGNQISANSMYGGKGWGKVGVWESPATELKGWGDCSTTRAERYRTNFAHGASVIADVNGDAKVEVVAVGNVYDCAAGHPPGKYNGVYVFNADRSRFNLGGFDWRDPPVDTGAPLTEDYGVIENNQPNPVVADLDGDGKREILYASYDGRVHAFWLDKTEHYNWPYSVYTGGIYRFASEPAVADLDNDGKAEVVFASWTQKASNQAGKLHIVNHMGQKLHEVDLPPAFSGDWNGALAAPTLADIDGDGELEVALNTAHSGLVAYDLPGTANARILWGTGRGNYQRSGSSLQGTLQGSVKNANPMRPGPGDTVTFTILLRNPGPVITGVRITDTLPSQVNYAGNLWASAGSYGQANGMITWTGSVSGSVPVTLTFNVTVSAAITIPHAILNTALVDDGMGKVWQRQAMVIANGLAVYLPIVMR
jgi:uncharacterized repeat protein (TIGR01451 family)